MRLRHLARVPLQADLDADLAAVYAASDGRLPAAEWLLCTGLATLCTVSSLIPPREQVREMMVYRVGRRVCEIPHLCGEVRLARLLVKRTRGRCGKGSC